MKCPTCGDEHELLDPIFVRPDVILAMSVAEKKGRVFETDDICALRGEAGGPDRFFVRCTLAVRLLDAPGVSRWGLWVEVSGEDSVIIRDAWDDPSQDKLPPMQARLSNRVQGYPDTIDLPVSLRLTGPSTRPELSLPADSLHPFVQECARGVCTHRVKEWLDGMAG